MEAALQHTTEIFSKALFLLKDFFAHPAGRAGPALRNLLPRGAGGNTVIGVAYRRIIDIAARANVLIHNKYLLTD